MYPELIHFEDLPVLGDFTITSFGVMMALAFLTGFWILRVQLREAGEDPEFAGDILLGALVGGIVGAKLYYVLLYWERTAVDPFGMLFSRGGLVWYGGLIGGALGVILMTRRRGARLWHVADICAPALALSYAVGRVGCFLVGDDYGRPTDSWVGIAFPRGAPPSTAGNLRERFGVDIPASVPDARVLEVHPTQVYEVAMATLIFLLLWRMRGTERPEGWLFALWLLLAGVERFIVEIFRAKDDRIFGPLTVAQVISIALVLIGLYMIWRRGGSAADRRPATVRAREHA